MAAMEKTVERKDLVVEIADGEGHLALNRPSHRNAISEDIFIRMREAAKAFDADDAVRVVVLRSLVPGIFCAGADIETLADPSPAALAYQFELLVDCIADLRSIRKPVVMIVDGDCLGAGCALAAAADIVVATDHARFCLPEIHLGLAPVLAVAVMFPIVETRQLVYWATRGHLVSARDACAAGLVTTLATRETLQSDVRELLQDLKKTDSFPFGMLKRAVETLNQQWSDATRRDLFDAMLATATHPAAQSAVSAFLNRKRSKRS
jgi:enoyl-CoA hydratase/carnithine racemase